MLENAVNREEASRNNDISGLHNDYALYCTVKNSIKITRDMRWIGPYYPIIACHNFLHIIELKMSSAEEMSQVNSTAI